ncbi:MAG: hypothetical protein ACOYKE_13215 [Ferruginibacter sp.]
MMIKIFALVALFLTQFNPTEVLVNTKWEGSLNIPTEVNGGIEFKKDTMYIMYENNIVETMTYKEKGDSLFIQKVSGGSPCEAELGTYTFKIAYDILVLNLVQDNCSERSEAFSPAGYKKVN